MRSMACGAVDVEGLYAYRLWGRRSDDIEWFVVQIEWCCVVWD